MVISRDCGVHVQLAYVPIYCKIIYSYTSNTELIVVPVVANAYNNVPG